MSLHRRIESVERKLNQRDLSSWDNILERARQVVGEWHRRGKAHGAPYPATPTGENTPAAIQRARGRVIASGHRPELAKAWGMDIEIAREKEARA